MAAMKLILLASLVVMPVIAQHGLNYSTTMGPVAFMWPPDREWGAAVDNTPPCGSAAGVTNRTRFPNENGHIALVIQDESWSVSVAISYAQNPKSQADFHTIVNSNSISEIDTGHMCYPIPAPNNTDNVRPGTNATIQIMYTSDFEEHRNQTFYACADIRYVPASVFNESVPCFNATDNHYNIQNGTTSSSNSGDSSHQLSGGAIAGVVIAVLVIVAGILTAVFFIYRRKKQQERARESAVSPRVVKWEPQSPSTLAGSPSPSKSEDIVLNDIRKV